MKLINRMNGVLETLLDDVSSVSKIVYPFAQGGGYILTVVTVLAAIANLYSEFRVIHYIVTGVLVAIAFCIFCTTIFVKRAREAELEIWDAQSFDYKFYASQTSGSFNALLTEYDVNAIEEGRPRCICAYDKKYVKVENFFKGENKLSKDFHCLPVRTGEKRKGCCLQISFVPMDKDGNVPLILRLPTNHGRAAMSKHKKNDFFTFLSFSPVPMKFNSPFSISECYYREVPRPRDEQEDHFPRFVEVAMLLQKISDNRYYHFYVIIAKYDKLSFVTNEMPNWELLCDLFAPKDESPEEHFTDTKSHSVRFFVKDHDPILYVAPAKSLYHAFCENHNVTSDSPILKKIPKEYVYRVGNRHRTHKIKLSNPKYQKVEETILELISNSRSLSSQLFQQGNC